MNSKGNSFCVALFAATLLATVAGCSGGTGLGEGTGPSDAGGSHSDGASSSGSGSGGSSGGSSGSSSGGLQDAGGPWDSASPLEDGGRRSIPTAVLARHALCYSGYRANEDPTATPPTYPTEAEVTADLKLLVQGGWTFLRLFDCSPHASVVLKSIRDNNFDIKIMQGVWIAGARATSDADNQAEIQRCLALNATYGDVIVAFSVGNETLDAWSSMLVGPVDLTQYIDEVRAQVTQPVTTDDFAPVFEFGSDTLPDGGPYSYAGDLQVLQAIDFISLHSYPFIDAPYQSWDYQQLAVPAGPQRAAAMMTAAQAYNVSQVTGVQQALAGKGLDVPIVIGETGWKSKGDMGTFEVSLAHPVNEKIFYDTEMAWVYGGAKDATSPLALFYFEASDEPWKLGDDNWGLFDTNRYAKYVIWGTFPNLVPPGSPMYTQADAVYYKPGDPTNPPM
jgi:exo-beta-1,3-glucanase (GH17 family)